MRPFTALLDVLAPASCLTCGRTGATPWCQDCRADVWSLHAADGEVRVADLDRIHALLQYRGPVADVVVRGKLRGLHAVWRPCGRMLRVPGVADVIVPVPTDRRRRRERGFDHTALLARGLRDASGLPVLAAVRAPSDGLDRGRDAGHAHGRRWPVVRRLDGARVVLVDDVVTTGATLREVAAACRRAGAVRVAATVLAATPRVGPVRRSR